MDKQNDRCRWAGSDASGAKSLVTVSVLLVIIIGLIALLWVRERRARVAAQASAVHFEAKSKKLEGAMGDLIVQMGPGQIQPVSRADLPTKPANIDGQATNVFEISPAAGRRFGFRGGDVIFVRGEATTQNSE